MTTTIRDRTRPRRRTASSGALPVADGRQVRRHAYRLVRERHAGRFTLAAGLHVAAGVASLGPPLLLGRMVDTIVAGGAAEALRAAVDAVAIAIALLLVVQTVLTWAANTAMGELGERILAGLRETFLRDVVHLPLATVERAGTGDLISRSSADVDALSESVREAVPNMFTAFVTTAIVLAGAVWVSPVMALSALAMLPVVVPVGIWYGRRSPRAFAAIRSALAGIATTLSESASGAHTVEALRWERRRAERIDRDIARSWRYNLHTLRLRTVLFPMTDLAMFLPLLASLLVGGGLALAGHATVGEVATVSVLMQMLMNPLVLVVLSLERLQMGNAALARLVGVGLVEPDRRPTGRVPAEDPEEDIRAEGVRFGYTPDRDVLHGVDLSLRRGERLALVGPTGAGKSTLGRLIAGIHGPRAGMVTAGGVPLVELDPERLRARVALITQEHHVFVGTLAENLRLAAPRADDEQLVRALALVGGAEWTARLPDGLHTRLGGEYTAPTPGEAQLIALARLAVAAPPTLVLDEATSQLDAGAAEAAESALAEVLHGRTVVMIAHRLQTAHDADRIGVVEQGRLVELGTHQELLARGGAYRRLWESWHG